jgi:signal transduction histidine kinase
VLEVRDEGPGIDEAALGRVFDPFWRGVASGSPERSPPGQGLGLTIAERLCAAAGWSLSIRSGPGRGTCVRVALDAAAA